MGVSIAAAQNTLELYKLGYLKNSKNIFELGSQDLHLKSKDLKQLFDDAGLDSKVVDEYPNLDNWPGQPRCSARFFYESLGIKDYHCMDTNGNHGSIVHDLNKPFEDKSKFNKFDIVTDHGTTEHIFNIAECYKTMHNLTKPGGYMIVSTAALNSLNHAYFLFDESFIEGIAAANKYKVIYNSYVLHFKANTKSGSAYQFHIPKNKILFNSIDFAKLSQVNIYGVLQKTTDEEFKIPYQGNLMKDVYNLPGGFNRIHHREPMGYTYIPSSTLTIEEAPLRYLIKALIVKFKKILRIKMAKKVKR